MAVAHLWDWTSTKLRQRPYPVLAKFKLHPSAAARLPLQTALLQEKYLQMVQDVDLTPYQPQITDHQMEALTNYRLLCSSSFFLLHPMPRPSPCDGDGDDFPLSVHKYSCHFLFPIFVLLHVYSSRGSIRGLSIFIKDSLQYPIKCILSSPICGQYSFLYDWRDVHYYLFNKKMIHGLCFLIYIIAQRESSVCL